VFDIRFTEGAVEDLRDFTKSDQERILKDLESELLEDAGQESNDRKRLHSTGPVEWELRLGNVRIFYDVNLQNRTVKIEAVGKRFFI
jgi:mRNA-degrading endonuclease RelE of RelBE toxin-antitoxin system